MSALVALDAVPPEEVRPLLTDPAAAVVRAASLALLPYRRRVPAALLWQLIADPRPEVRLGAYRLFRVRGPAQRMAAALTLAGDAEWSLGWRGREETLRLILALHRDRPADLGVAPGEELPSDLRSLAERARPMLGHLHDRVDRELGVFPVSIAGAARSSSE